MFSARRGSTEDVRFAIQELRSKGIIAEDQPIVGIGWSLGGCIINNTILEQDEMNPEVKFSAAAALGAPYNLHQSSELLKPFPNWIYSKRMCEGLINILKPGKKKKRKSVCLLHSFGSHHSAVVAVQENESKREREREMIVHTAH